MLLFSLNCYSQAIDISKNWKITIGDTSVWASSSFNDSAWKTMENIAPFERSGFPDFQHFGWVRKEIIIPSTFKDDAKKYGYFYLSLGKINDADQAFFNGKLVGQTGGMPPGSISVNRGQRIYKVDAKNILWDEENLIAVRIFSNFHNGGLWGENFRIIIPSETVFHIAKRNIPDFPLSKHQQAFETSTVVDSSQKEEALKAGGLSLKINLPEHTPVFYNDKYIGKTAFSGNDSFFVPAHFISWDHPDKITVYLDDINPLEKILFTTPVFNTVRGDGFNFMQVSNFKIKNGSFNSNVPVAVSAEVFNTTNNLFEGSLSLSLATDINKIQQSSSHFLRLNKMESKEINITLLPNFSGVYEINYILLKNNTRQKMTGTLMKGEKM